MKSTSMEQEGKWGTHGLQGQAEVSLVLTAAVTASAIVQWLPQKIKTLQPFPGSFQCNWSSPYTQLDFKMLFTQAKTFTSGVQLSKYISNYITVQNKWKTVLWRKKHKSWNRTKRYKMCFCCLWECCISGLRLSASQRLQLHENYLL